MAMLMHGGVNYSGTTGSNTITLTQAEYDALPVEEQMDPEKVYYITDGVPTSTTVIPNPVTPATEDLNTLQIEETVYQIAGNGGSQVYDDTERVIGTWFGETLYQKTFNLNMHTVSDNTWTTNILGTSGISIKKYDGLFCLGGTPYANFDYYRGTSEYFTASLSNNGSDISVRPNMNAGVTIEIDKITLQYTKTTD